MGFLFGTSNALAAAPPANTVIGNQASASYVDPNGANQLATSNLVQTTVQQVGSFTLDGFSTETTNVVNSKTGAAGATVYAPHVLTNTGNGADSFTVTTVAQANFSKVQVFADANADGLPDSTTPLCSVVPDGTLACSFTTPQIAGGNGTFPFVVAYSIPSSANSTSFPSPREATVKAVATNTTLYANPSAADKDNVSLTTAAAFNASKSLSAPAVGRPGGAAWPTASSGPVGTTATYTLTFSNTGGAAGTFALTDVLPSGFTYQPGSAVWSSAPGVALVDAGPETGAASGIDYAFDSTNNKITFVVNSLQPNTTQTVSFVVEVKTTAAVGTSTTTNKAMYNPQNAHPVTTDPAPTSTNPGDTNSPTNPAPFTVTGTYGVVLGSFTNGNVTQSHDNPTPGVPNANTADEQTVASAVMGSTVKFQHKVFNAGNVQDIVNLTLTGNNFPVGTTFALYHQDQVTPLIDNNADGIVDTGNIPAGGEVVFTLVATLPASASAPAGSFDAVVRGTSAGDVNEFDATRAKLTKVVGTLVDLTNTATGNGTPGNTGNGDVGTGPSPQPTTTLSTPAGTGVLFNLFVKNNDSVNNTYNLAASQTNNFPGTLPAGWTVKFVAAGGTCASPGITQVTVPAGNTLTAGSPTVLACVTPPASQVPVTEQKVYFKVTSTVATSSGVVATDTKLDAVTVTAPNTFSATLTPNNTGQVTPGGSVVYAHTLTNTGGQSCAGPYTFTATLPAADANAGWTTALYIDVNGDGQIDGGDTLVTGPIPGPLPVAGTQKLLVKVFAPGGATAGTVDTATVTVTFPAGTNSCGSPSATDISTVITGQIRLVKTQALDINCDGTEVPSSSAPLTAKPGECLVYRVIATNEGAAPVTNISINDAVPAYTSLTGATQPATRCSSSGVSPALTNTNSVVTATAVSCGSTSNTVAPSGNATLTFSVKVNN